MTIADLSTIQLQKLVQLVQQKELLQAKLAKVEAALIHFDEAPINPVQRAPRKATRRKGIPLKNAILTALLHGGPNGLSAKEIALKAGAKVGSVSVWIYTDGQKVKGLKKIAPGRFIYRRPA